LSRRYWYLPLSWKSWNWFECAVGGVRHPQHRVPDNVHQLHVQQPSTYEKPEAASAVLGSWWWAVCRPKHVELHINIWNNKKFWYIVASCWIFLYELYYDARIHENQHYVIVCATSYYLLIIT
jgi:hypothetical protein